MPTRKQQVIVEVGSEGGSLTLYGLKDRASAWEFTCQTNEAALPASLFDDLDSGAGQRTSAPVTTWAEALQLFDRYPWPRLYPLNVHPDFGQAVWEAVLERGKKTERRDLQAWLSLLPEWVNVCFPPAAPRGKRSGRP
jgi:hypothetical protein